MNSERRSTMPQRLRSAPALFAIALASQGMAGGASAQTQRALEPEARSMWNKLEGPAAADVFRHAQGKRLQCHGFEGERPCTLAQVTDRVDLHHAPSGAGQPLALAVISYNPDTGNSMLFDLPLMRREPDGRYRRIADVEGLVGFPEKVSFEGGAITIVTMTLRGNDARCCPSGRTTWRIDAATGRAVYASGYRSRDWAR
jgi:hypothetical protein